MDNPCDPSSEPSSTPIAPATLLSLPTDLLPQIARDVAPLGGKKAANFRLVDRQLARVATPVVLSSLLPANRTETDEILTAVLRDLPHWVSLVTSIRYTVPDEAGDLVYAVLELLKNLLRLSVDGDGADVGDPFFESLERMSALEVLELEYIDLTGQGTFNSWTSARHLVLKYCYGATDVFPDEDGVPGYNGLESLDFCAAPLTTAAVLLALWSGAGSMSQATLTWDSAKLSPGLVNTLLQRSGPETSIRQTRARVKA